jgi:hypothetical protein
MFWSGCCTYAMAKARCEGGHAGVEGQSNGPFDLLGSDGDLIILHQLDFRFLSLLVSRYWG